MFNPLFPFPQFADGVLGLTVGFCLVFLSVILILIAVFLRFMVYEEDKWVVKAAAKASGIFMISGILGPLFVGDWAVLIPITMVLGTAWYLTTK